jgi:ribosomal protein S18 acetylase RimI-like enzyme
VCDVGAKHTTTTLSGEMAEVTVRAMSEPEFAGFRERAVRGYAAAHVQAGNWDAASSEERAARDMDGLLPQGPATPGMLLLSAEAEPGVVGWIWIALARDDEPGAWIYQIEIDPSHRGRGYGRALLAAAEEEVRRRGVTALGLNVFGENLIARRLYESAGYEATTVQMRKRLG